MVSRNLKATVTIGGAIASSLPSSVKKAVAELDRLKVVHQADVAEATRLKTTLRGLTKGTDDYKARVQQLKKSRNASISARTKCGRLALRRGGLLVALQPFRRGLRRYVLVLDR